MKRFSVLLLTFVMLFSMAACTGSSNSNASQKSTNAQSAPSKTEQTTAMESDEFEFIYGLSSISEDFWNATYMSMGDYYSITNRDMYNERYQSTFGGPQGALSIKPMGFTETVIVGYESSQKGKDNYILTVNDNDFLYPWAITVIDDKVTSWTSTLTFYVLGNDLSFYIILLSIDNNPKNIVLNETGWQIVQETDENSDVFCTTAYHAVNSDYCLTMTFPKAYSPEYLNSLNETFRNQYATQFPFTKEQVQELAERVTSLITFEKTNPSDEELYTVSVFSEDISLDANTVVNISDARLVSWHSGPDDLVSKGSVDCPTITFLNKAGNDFIYLMEFTSEENLNFYLLFNDFALKDYSYNGKNVSIAYFTDTAAYEKARGLYSNIIFSIGDKWYGLSNSLTTCDPSVDDVDQWIFDLCDGVLSFKN